MRTSFPFAVTAALLVTLSPVYAANPLQSEAGKMAIHKDDRATADSTAPANADDGHTATVIILDPDSLQAVPNPYGNPEPRMISDAWAMRT